MRNDVSKLARFCLLVLIVSALFAQSVLSTAQASQAAFGTCDECQSATVAAGVEAINSCMASGGTASECAEVGQDARQEYCGLMCPSCSFCDLME